MNKPPHSGTRGRKGILHKGDLHFPSEEMVKSGAYELGELVHVHTPAELKAFAEEVAKETYLDLFNKWAAAENKVDCLTEEEWGGIEPVALQKFERYWHRKQRFWAERMEGKDG